jgi:hypothetical protein
MAGFYSGATGTTPPLHWPTIALAVTVTFNIDKVNGQFTVTKIEKVK